MNSLNSNILSLRGILMEANFNRHLGSKLRMKRLALGLTQTKVAQAINVTFQQIQKYEKGTNVFITPLDKSLSIVNLFRDQSHEHPNFFN